MPQQADVLLVTATEVETLAVQGLFQGETGHEARPRFVDSKTFYYLGTVAETAVFQVQSEMGAGGLGAALLTVKKGIEALDPGAVIMVGIALGIDEGKQQIGDVLVSKQMFLYEQQRVGTLAGAADIRLRGDKPSASPRLLDRLRHTSTLWSLRRRSQPLPQVHFGTVVTGEKLVDNAEMRAQLLKWEPEMIGGEMEGGGLYVAATDSKVEWILVKAICDWGVNKHEDKEQRQETAAHNAAMFVLDTIRQGGLRHPDPGSRRQAERPGGAGAGGVTIHNSEPNQGLQGQFHGPITINNDNRRS